MAPDGRNTCYFKPHLKRRLDDDDADDDDASLFVARSLRPIKSNFWAIWKKEIKKIEIDKKNYVTKMINLY